MGFLLQTQGLQDTLAGVSGFLTGVSILLTPVAAALLFDERIGRRGWAAVLVGTVGLAMLAGGVTAGSLLGATLTVGGAVAITGLSQWATSGNALGLTAWSVTVAAVTCAGVAWVTGGVDLPPNGSAWVAVGYLAFAATCLGFRGAGLGPECPDRRQRCRHHDHGAGHCGRCGRSDGRARPDTACLVRRPSIESGGVHAGALGEVELVNVDLAARVVRSVVARAFNSITWAWRSRK